MALTDKKKASNKRSDQKNSQRFSIITTKEKGAKIESYIQKTGMTKNNFFMEAIKEKIERDTGKSFDEFIKENQPEQEQHQEQDQENVDND